MPEGTPVNRHWVITLIDGRMVIDWSDGTALDFLTEEFIELDTEELTYPVTDEDLEPLLRSGQIPNYDNLHVYFYGLPTKPRGDVE